MALCVISDFAVFVSAKWQPTKKFQELKKLAGNTMYYQILSQLKNATGARKEKMTMPYSKMDHAVLKSLAEGGYIKSVEKEAVGKKNILIVKLAKGTFNDFKIISKPSRHFYVDYRSLKKVLQGYGLGVLSTSKGIMTDREARKQKVGGEYLFEIW
jgi:small subunit ribosomal protein S8